MGRNTAGSTSNWLTGAIRWSVFSCSMPIVGGSGCWCGSKTCCPRGYPSRSLRRLEHFTATLAERMLGEELQKIPGDPEARNLLNWHAVEELEHKSVAFDVYRSVRGPEWLRIGVMGVLYVLVVPVITIGVLLSITTVSEGWHPIKVARQARAVFRGPLLKGFDSRPAHVNETRLSSRRCRHLCAADKWQELFGTHGDLVGYEVAASPASPN